LPADCRIGRNVQRRRAREHPPQLSRVGPSGEVDDGARERGDGDAVEDRDVVGVQGAADAMPRMPGRRPRSAQATVTSTGSSAPWDHHTCHSLAPLQ
jgi:hypothetical protein